MLLRVQAKHIWRNEASVLMISSVLRAQPRLKVVIFCCDPRPHHHTSPPFYHQPRSFTWYPLHTPSLYHTTAFRPFHSPLRPSSTLLCFTVFSTTSQHLASFQIWPAPIARARGRHVFFSALHSRVCSAYFHARHPYLNPVVYRGARPSLSLSTCSLLEVG